MDAGSTSKRSPSRKLNDCAGTRSRAQWSVILLFTVRVSKSRITGDEEPDSGLHQSASIESVTAAVKTPLPRPTTAADSEPGPGIKNTINVPCSAPRARGAPSCQSILPGSTYPLAVSLQAVVIKFPVHPLTPSRNFPETQSAMHTPSGTSPVSASALRGGEARSQAAV